MVDYRPRKLPQEAVDRLEARLTQDPDDAEARSALLGHYSRAAPRECGQGDSSARLVEHARWIVSNQPGSSEAREAACIFLSFCRTSRQVKEEFLQLWLRQAAAHSADPDVLFNAALFLKAEDEAKALELLKQARQLAPGRADLTSMIDHIHQLRSASLDVAGRRELGRKRLHDIEDHLPVGPDGVRKKIPPELAERLGMACFEAEEYDKAERAAHAMLHYSPTQGWNAGNLYFKGHMILGLVALKREDLAKAREHLLASAGTKGSPQLNSFGPNMSLAKELLERGDTTTVVEYLERCGVFWNKPKLKEWIAVARAGIIPDFGPNLRY